MASARDEVLKMNTKWHLTFTAFVLGTFFVPALLLIADAVNLVGEKLFHAQAALIPITPNPEFWTLEKFGMLLVLCVGFGILFAVPYFVVRWDKEILERESLRIRQLEKELSRE